MFLFDGWGSATFENDLWAYYRRENVWIPITAINGPPSARSEHCMVGIGLKIYSFAGSDAGGQLNDLWIYTPDLPSAIGSTVSPVSGGAPLTVTFSGVGTDTGSIFKYEWDFDGNGTYDWSSTVTGNTTYTYSTPGTYNPVFRIIDDDYLILTKSFTVTVNTVGVKKVTGLVFTDLGLGLSGITVKAIKLDGSVIKTTTTDATGAYTLTLAQ